MMENLPVVRLYKVVAHMSCIFDSRTLSLPSTAALRLVRLFAEGRKFAKYADNIHLKSFLPHTKWKDPGEWGGGGADLLDFGSPIGLVCIGFVLPS